MGLISHVKGHWLGWLGILVGVTGAGLSWYFYQESREIRDPVFIVDPNRVEIVSTANIATAPIKVLRRDGKPISADVYAVRFFFWNAGARSIRPENVLDTLQITLLDSTSEILDFKLLRISRPITRITLDRGAGQRTLILHLAILERADGLAGQIIYQGKSTAALRVSGTIEGAQVRTTTAPPMLALIPAAAVALVLIGVALVFVYFLFDKMLGGLVARVLARHPRLRAAVPGIIGVLVLLTMLIIGVRQQEAADVASDVPTSLR